MFKTFVFIFAIFLSCRNVSCCDINKALDMTYGLTDSGNTGKDAMRQSGHESNDRSSVKEVNLTESMNLCNESFRISIKYLEELNNTGSFPDESDKTPMCFIKCYLDKVGILSTEEGTVNKQKAMEMLSFNSEDALDDCIKDMDQATNICERAYFLARCVMTRALVDGRSKDSK